MVYPIDIIFEQKISSLLILGGVLGTFLYYLNPVERVLAFYLHIRKLDTWEFITSSVTYTYSKTKILQSPLLKEDLTRITGAFFFFISLLLSERLLSIVNINLPFWILVVSAVVILVIGIWETRVVLKEKMNYVIYYYFFVRFGRPFTSELLNAIEKKDWTGAHSIINRVLLEGSIYAARGGVCSKCKTIVTEGSFCTECGMRLVSYCSECKASIVREGTATVPKYCFNCGKVLEYGKGSLS